MARRATPPRATVAPSRLTTHHAPLRPLARRSHLTHRSTGSARASAPRPLSKRAAVNLETVRRIALALPGVEEGPCYGTPGFRVRGRILARLREDGETLAVKCGEDEPDFRMEADPETFFVTEHYRGYPIVVVRLNHVGRAALRKLLEHAWRRNAPKRLVAEHDRRK